MVLVAWASKPVKPVKLFTPRFQASVPPRLLSYKMVDEKKEEGSWVKSDNKS